MKCKYCGHENPNGATKCKYCKAAIEVIEKPQKNKRRKKDGIRD